LCDTVAGELIMCFPRLDMAARNLASLLREKQVEHIEYVDSLEDKLRRLDLPIDPSFDFDVHLLRVPSGQESWKITFLQFCYKHELLKLIPKAPPGLIQRLLGRSDYQFTVAPNHLLSLASPSVGVLPVSAKNFQFGNYHSLYRKSIGLPSSLSSSGDKIRVLVLDSGVAADTPITIADQRNIVDPNNSHSAPDDHGHGTGIALVIHDLAPSAEFIVYKVADATGRISEWDAVAGMAAKSNSNVVNLSMQFGLLDKGKGCAVCGRESRASRSAIFENILAQLANRTPRPIVVAAAGNYQADELAYPSRFADVLAIGAITSQRILASDCNKGDEDQAGSPHKNHFVLPGGETNPAKIEPVLRSGRGKNWSGSSFAAAFASGLIAELLNRGGIARFDFDSFVDGLRQRADKNLLPTYSTAEFGNGLMRA
jgi:subtilisin family serine protease